MSLRNQRLGISVPRGVWVFDGVEGLRQGLGALRSLCPPSCGSLGAGRCQHVLRESSQTCPELLQVTRMSSPKTFITCKGHYR